MDAINGGRGLGAPHCSHGGPARPGSRCTCPSLPGDRLLRRNQSWWAVVRCRLASRLQKHRGRVARGQLRAWNRTDFSHRNPTTIFIPTSQVPRHRQLRRWMPQKTMISGSRGPQQTTSMRPVLFSTMRSGRWRKMCRVEERCTV
jgi:hypothetical protein